MPSNEVRVAISGKSGCGNTTVSRMLAERLDVRLINYTFRTLAAEEGVSFEQMRAMAEEDDRWDRLLDERQAREARRQSCVLGSRLAVWVLPEADLRVYLAASVEVRARRIQQREGGSLEEVFSATNERDRTDRARYLRLYELDIDEYGFVDVVIDAGVRGPAEIVQQIISRLGLQ